jgi:Domain of unknown function (DUF6458)
MGIGTSLVLIAVGAVLAFAINMHERVASTTVHWHTLGWILIIVGAIGLVISLVWLTTARRRGVMVERDEIIDGGRVV